MKKTKIQSVVQDPPKQKTYPLRTVINPMLFDHRDFPGKVITGESQTIPGQALSVPEMIRRQQAGLTISGVKVPFYTGEHETPDFERMDINELYQFRAANDAIIKNYNDAVKAREQLLQKSKIEKAHEEKLKKEAAAQSPLPTDQK